MPCHVQITPPSDPRIGTPFVSAEDAWFWFIAAQAARNDGARYAAARGGVARPCEPIDILRTLDRLHRGRLLTMDHVLVLRHYGVRFMPPDRDRPLERRAAKLWGQALDRLETALVKKGIVSPRRWYVLPDHQMHGGYHA